jgi:hypothetical protein
MVCFKSFDEEHTDNERLAESANFNKILAKFSKESCDRCHTIKKKKLTLGAVNYGLDGFDNFINLHGFSQIVDKACIHTLFNILSGR